MARPTPRQLPGPWIRIKARLDLEEAEATSGFYPSGADTSEKVHLGMREESEPPRVGGRLQFSKGWGHDKTNEALARGKALEQIPEAETALQSMRALGAALLPLRRPVGACLERFERRPWRVPQVPRKPLSRLRDWSRSAFLRLLDLRFSVIAVRSPMMVLAQPP